MIICFIVPILLGLIYKFLDWIIRIRHVDKLNERYILITGCDTGFGKLAVKRLDSLGCYVFAGCLTESGETELKKSCSTRMTSFNLDLSSRDSISNALTLVTSRLPADTGLWGVINNAGVLGPVCPIEWQTIDQYKSVADVNLFGLIDVTMTFLPLVKKCKGRIVNTSSIAGRIATISRGAYSVSKWGVEAFSDTLRRNIEEFGVKVILIEPGAYATCIASARSKIVEQSWLQLSQNAKDEYGEEFLNYYLGNMKSPKWLQFSSSRLSDVVDAYINALFCLYPRRRYVVGVDAKALIFLTKLPEWFSDWFLLAGEKFFYSRPIPKALRCKT